MAFLRKYATPILLALILLGGITAALIIGEDKKPKTAVQTSTLACGKYRDDINVVINGHTFKTELTKTQQERQKGLGGRKCIAADQAMLFSFTKPGQYAFWMKDMKFPIDILWIGPDKRVAAQEIDVSPSTYFSKNPYFENDPNHPAQFVLEVKANISKSLNITLGTPVEL